MAESLIALGGNLGDVRGTFDRALGLLCDGVDVFLVARSSNYLTPPWGVENQPPFINCCALIETRLSPRDLLTRAQQVEHELGRDRSKEQRWGQRTLDIDLLTYDDITMDDPALTLPHPRMFERAFVLVPLADIAPDRVIGGIRVRDALANVDATGIERLFVP